MNFKCLLKHKWKTTRRVLVKPDADVYKTEKCETCGKERGKVITYTGYEQSIDPDYIKAISKDKK